MAKAGRKPYIPTDQDKEIVKKLAGYGMTDADIARVIINPTTNKPINHQTLTKYFSDSLAQGKAEIKAKVMKTAYRLAVSGESPAMTMFWLKTRCGWREKDRIEDQQQEAPPVKVEFTVKDARVDTGSTEPASE